MDLGWRDQFTCIVIPAWQAYLVAEQELSAAQKSGDEALIHKARMTALREGAAAATFLHHFLELVAAEKPDWFPATQRLKDGKAWLASHCKYLRSDKPIDDVTLLGDVVDALKHSELRDQTRAVAHRGAVLIVATGIGMLPHGEGKFGGSEQIVIDAKSGPRALSAVLQNVVDAWRRGAGLELPAVGEP